MALVKNSGKAFVAKIGDTREGLLDALIREPHPGFSLIPMGDDASDLAGALQQQTVDAVVFCVPCLRSAIAVLEVVNAVPQCQDVPKILLLDTDAIDEEQGSQLFPMGLTELIRLPVKPEHVKMRLAVATAERRRFGNLKDEVQWRKSAIGQIMAGRFRFQTRREARNLATMLSIACPHPLPVAVGLAELLLNAVEHGCLELTGEEKGDLIAEGRLDEEIKRRRARPEFQNRYGDLVFEKTEAAIRFEASDPGPGFDVDAILSAPLTPSLAPHGRGILIARDCFDSLRYLGGGSRVVAIIHPRA